MGESINWRPLGKMNIKKAVLYSPMCWNDNVELIQGGACISKYGGAIGVIYGSVQPNKSKRSDIVIYNAAGKEISSFRWNSGAVIGVSWTHADDLVFIQEDGQVLLYDIFCQFKTSFTMGKECRENRVLEFEVFTSQQGTGLAVMNGLHRFFLVNNIDDPKVRMLADVPGLRSTPPSCWCVLPGTRSSCVIAANDKDIYLLDVGGECHQQNPSGLNSKVTSFIKISLSLDGKHVALFTDSGLLWMGSSNFQQTYCEINTGNGSRPSQMLWCCESISSASSSKSFFRANFSVVIHRPGSLLIIGPNKDWVKYELEEQVNAKLEGCLLGADVDGVHFVTQTEHCFIQYVSDSVYSIFKIGSMAPGALLYDATEEYSQGSKKADEYLRMLVDNNNLESAVEECLEAACAEFNPAKQKKLLQAASFGKSFLPGMKFANMFVETCSTLRVLNAVRCKPIGFSLTQTQLKHLSMEVLIDRLVQRRFFHLAFQICKYLKILPEKGASRILSHWACYKVQQTDIADDQIADSIRDKLRCVHGVSYASIAEQAVACGRSNLAVKLLEYELRASEQVRMLAKLGKHRLALEKAVGSGSTDLIYSAISSLRERSSLSEFLVEIRQQPTAYKLHLKFCREQNEKMLKDLFEQEDRFFELAHSYIRDSIATFRADERAFFLHQAHDCYCKAHADFQAKATDEQLILVREQNVLEQELDGNFMEASLHDTIYNLLLSNQIKQAEHLRKLLKVSDKRWWRLRITTLAEQKNFIELENFSKTKKSPVGYLPFIEACMRHGASNEVAKYILKVSPDHRVAALLKSGNIGKAGELAVQMKSIADMDQVIKKCGASNRDLAEQLRTTINQLQRR